MSYTANDIETLSFRDAVRSRVEMYMGSADNQYLHCAQGGTQVVTSMSRAELFSFMLRGKVDDLKAAFAFEYDGSPAIYFDAHATTGLQGSGFDDDFFEKGIHSAMFKGSGGQNTYFKLDDALSYMVGKVS